MTVKVKVKEIDTSMLDSGGRTLNVKPKGKSSFLTPTQPFSRPELTANSYLTFDGSFKINLGAIQIDIKGRRYDKFFRENGEVKKIIRRITKFSDMMCFQENFTVLDMKPLNPDDIKKQKLLLETQLIPRYLSNISIPLITTTKSIIFKKIINEWVKNAEQFGKGTIPQISLNENLESLKKKLKVLTELAETDTINIVNVRYANPINYLTQYVELWNMMRENELLINCYNVPRSGLTVGSGLHDSPILKLQRYGIDTVTFLTNTPTEEYFAKLKFMPSLESIDELDFDWPYHPGGVVLPSDFWKELPIDKVECNCKLCKKREQEDIIHNYCYNDIDEIDNLSMGYASKIHTTLSSEIVFKKLKKYITSNEMKYYVDIIENQKKDFNIEYSNFSKNVMKN